MPSWSPSGEWIVCGNNLISPDGQTRKPLGEHHTQNYVFSQDGKLLYGLREEADTMTLFSIDLSGGPEKPLGQLSREFRPLSNLHPAIRFSMAPDGKSFIYGTGRFNSNLWMLQGFAPKAGLLARLGLR